MTGELGTDLTEETIFTWGAPPLKFGAGAVDEIGFEMAQFGARRVLILTDPQINALGIPARIAESLTKHGITSEIFDGVHVEPTDDSMDKAAGYAREQGPWDGFVAVGGGSSIDTAKAVNLLTTDGGSLMDYLNKPIGAGQAPKQQLKPLIAVPTTAGTGSESTAMCVLDVLSMRVKTGISHWRLRPTLAVIDPLLSLTIPPEVTASAGMDIVCHALESYTARWYTTFDRKQPEQRVTYCGSNPVSDLWCEKALTLLAQSFRTAFRHGDDLEARSNMMLAATFAGMGFGNSGRAHPARQRLPDRGHGQGLPAAELPAGRADGAARDVGLADRPGGVPVQLPQRARAPPGRRRAAGPGQGQAERRERAASVRRRGADARHRDTERHRRGRLHRGGHPRPGARHDEAAAAAGHLPAPGRRRGHRGDLRPVDRELVSLVPLYDYCCPQGHVFEQMATIAARAQQACPACGQVGDKIPSRVTLGGRADPGPSKEQMPQTWRGTYEGNPEYVGQLRQQWGARQKLEEKYPELRGDQRPVLAHEGKYHAKPLRAGDPPASA